MTDIIEIRNLREAAEFYSNYCLAKGHSPASVKSMQFPLEQFTMWAYHEGVTHPRDVDLEFMEKYRLYLHHYVSVKTGQPLNIKTQAKNLVHIKMMMRQLFRRRVVTHNNFEWFEIPKQPKSLPPKILKADEIGKILLHTNFVGMKGIRDRAIIEVFYATGIRRIELSNLKIADIDTAANQIKIIKGKGQKDRLIPIAPRAIQAITRYIKEYRPKLASAFSGDTLFLNRAGKPMAPNKLTHLMSCYVRRSGVSETGACHIFRHATATHMLDGGADIRHIQKQLGHASIASTEIYTHVSIKQLERVYHQTHPASSERNDHVDQ